MCWGATASIAMVGLGGMATVVTASRGAPRAIPITLGYFTLMEFLQASGYAVIDQCGSPANQTIALLSYLHIVFQPFFINAFVMELVPSPVKARLQAAVFVCCTASAVVMLLQVYPFDWAGACQIGQSLCAANLCVVSGDWHIAWNIPYNALLQPLEDATNFHVGFPTYWLTVFLLPLLYGAWRFALFHFVAGPLFAGLLTGNPNETPAIWCLFSIGLLLIGLSPAFRRPFEIRAWAMWPRAWTA